MDEVLNAEQIRNLENDIGCVQCGMPETHVTPMGHRCCRRKPCREYVRRVEGRLGLDDLFTHELSGTKLRDLN